MIVMKFGGSSVRDAERIEHVAGIIRDCLPQAPVVVISALAGTTNALLEAGETAVTRREVRIEHLRAHHIETAARLGIDAAEIETLLAELDKLLTGIALIGELSRKTSDHLVSFGERLAVRVVAPYLSRRGIPARAFDAWDLGLTTDSRFGDAQVLESSFAAVADKLKHLKADYAYTPIVTGFIAKDAHGSITTLGRGGSDLTASVLGAALDAEEIQVWKDVDGILTTDPRIAPAAAPVPLVSFEEASELAYFGAKVLHPLAMQPAMSRNIPVRVKNSYNPSHPGTLISGATQNGALLKAITCKRRVTLVDIVSSWMLGQYGFLAKVFESFAHHKISVDMVATSEVSISVTLNQNTDLEELVSDLRRIARVTVSRDKAILSLIGDVRRSSAILDATFRLLNQHGINVQMISQGASKVNIGLIVEDREIERCVALLHRHFFEGAAEQMPQERAA